MSTEDGSVGSGSGAGSFDPGCRYRLHPSVAVRPEPFGALVYHYGTRRLSFLKAPELVELVRALERYGCVREAVEATVPEPRRAAFLRALASLADSEMIVPA